MNQFEYQSSCFARPTSIPPAIEKFVSSKSPPPVRTMAARLLAPLPPADQLVAVFHLCFDDDPGISDTARQTLTNLPPHLRDTAISGPLPGYLLGFFACRYRDDNDALEKLVLNRNTDDETIEKIAKDANDRVLEIIASNQERLLRRPGIVEVLAENPRTGMATIDRVVSFLQREGVVVSLPGQAPLVPPLPSTGQHFAISVPSALVQEDDPAALTPEAIQEKIDQADERSVPLYGLVQQMTVSQKIVLALKGNKEARSILVKDSNRLVCSAVVKNPRVADSEIIAFAQARNVNDEVLRLISRNKDWTKIYKIQVALVNNPKTPIATALQFLKLLRQSDIKLIARSKAVPSGVSSAARRHLQAIEKRG